MTDATLGTATDPGEWQPKTPIAPSPLFAWPLQPLAILKFFFAVPGYFFSFNLLYMSLAIVAWLFLTPEMARMQSFAADWIGLVLLRNLGLMVLVFGAFHFRFYIRRAQGTHFKLNPQWPRTKHRRFLFGDQVRDNVFWSVASGCTIWTAFEVVTLWAFANGYIPYLNWEAHPVYFVLLFLAIPLIRDAHFYFVHRLLHYRLLYRTVHYLHHKNVNIGPWSGLAMHPVEHAIYFTGIFLHWIVLSHPLHAIFHVMHAGLSPALGHLGFDKLEVNGKTEFSLGQRYFHFLHHKYFECNYGGDGTVPLDKWFKSWHDGTPQSHAIMRQRRKQAHAD